MEKIQLPKAEENIFNLIEKCESIVNGYKTIPEIKHFGNTASYNCLYDVIFLRSHLIMKKVIIRHYFMK